MKAKFTDQLRGLQAIGKGGKMRNLSVIEEVEPDAWDMKMLEEYENEPNKEFVSFDECLARTRIHLSATPQQISLIIEQLPETEQKLILELVKRINPDDILTPEDIADVKEARAEYARGETIPDDAINWS